MTDYCYWNIDFRLAIEPWILFQELCRLALQTCRLTMEPWRLTLEPWRLNPTLKAHPEIPEPWTLTLII
jgi:hypothetical protein